MQLAQFRLHPHTRGGSGRFARLRPYTTPWTVAQSHHPSIQWCMDGGWATLSVHAVVYGRWLIHIIRPYSSVWTAACTLLHTHGVVYGRKTKLKIGGHPRRTKATPVRCHGAIDASGARIGLGRRPRRPRAPDRAHPPRRRASLLWARRALRPARATYVAEIGVQNSPAGVRPLEDRAPWDRCRRSRCQLRGSQGRNECDSRDDAKVPQQPLNLGVQHPNVDAVCFHACPGDRVT